MLMIHGKTMRLSQTASILGLAVGLALISLPAQSQDLQGRPRPHRHAPLRVEVAPSQRLFRQCVDWYATEHRASGDTIVPRMRCWWALR